MDREHISKCWYENVCQVADITDVCIKRTSCLRFLEMQYLMNNSGIPVNRQFPTSLEAGVDYSAFCELADIKDNIVEFVSEGKSVYIYSSGTGNGKTSWAIKLLTKYFDEVWAGNGFKIRGLFINVPLFLAQIKNFNDTAIPEFKELIADVDLVVWDDIASTGMSNYDLSQILTLIDQRVLECKANIYTGNITSKDSLERALGSRLTSRIWQSSQLVEFRGKDRR